MRQLVVLGIVGFIAQLIDGSLGMAYGASSATLLLFVGISPALASASVHISEVATTASGGWRQRACIAGPLASPSRQSP